MIAMSTEKTIRTRSSPTDAMLPPAAACSSAAAAACAGPAPLLLQREQPTR